MIKVIPEVLKFHTVHTTLRELDEKLDEWIDCRLKLQHYKDRIFSLQDRKFLVDYGKCLIKIGNLNSLFNKKLRELKARSEDNREIEIIEKIYKFSVFNNYLILTKQKNFFFREVPNTPLNFLFDKPEVKSAEAFKIAWKILEGKKIRKAEKYKKAVIIYYMLLILMNDLIYNGYNRNAIFLRYKESFLSFEKILEKLKREIGQVKQFESFKERKRALRKFLSFSILNTLAANTNQLLDENLSKKEQYRLQFEFISSNDIYIEPLSWYLANILWKLDKLFQDAVEFNEHKEEENRVESFIEHIKQLISVFFAKGKEIYTSDNDEIAWSSIFDAIYEVINFSYENFFYYKDFDELSIRFKEIDLKIGKLGGFFSFREEILREQNGKEFKKRLENLIEKGEDFLKIEKIIESLSKEELEILFTFYVEFLKEDAGFGEEDTVIGIYSSGIFLSHIANIFTRKNRYIWLFKIFPHLEIEPVHKHTILYRLPRILVIDESIKTGYSLQCLLAYLNRRNIALRNITFTSLWQLRDYPVIRELPRKEWNLKVLSAFSIEKQRLIKQPFLLKNRISSIDISSFNVADFDFDKKFSSIDGIFKGWGYWDMTYLIGATPFVVKIVDYWINNLLKNYSQYDKFYLFSPSMEGRVLMLMLSFFLKLKGKEVYLSSEAWKNLVIPGNYREEDNVKVLVDLSYHSGWTATSNFANHIDVSLPKARVLLEENNFFDSTLTVRDTLQWQEEK